jgi:hypothetical protein
MVSDIECVISNGASGSRFQLVWRIGRLVHTRKGTVARRTDGYLIHALTRSATGAATSKATVIDRR